MNPPVLSPRAIYAARAAGLSPKQTPAPESLPDLLQALDAALQSKDAEAIAEASAALSVWGADMPGMPGSIASGIGAAGAAASELQNLDDLITGLRALSAVLADLQERAAPPGKMAGRA